ncbi:hypothetical protein BDA99DRAFT_532859 [Phascolomyces articulosus]|uniref:Uncharacterized protein n=1 Tax=Phascolomyces articulosus TaxID=60185 RepID=A0AAD5KMI5_9FUNG|nr:hypothetical protein BDA99DRAFT_532859 [Phascolomyces articulosus]
MIPRFWSLCSSSPLVLILLMKLPSSSIINSLDSARSFHRLLATLVKGQWKYKKFCERVERLEQSVKSIYDIVDRIDKKFDLLISNQRQGSFDDLMSEEQSTDRLFVRTYLQNSLSNQEKSDGTKRPGAKKDIYNALMVLYKNDKQLMKTKMAGLGQHLSASINFMKTLLADKKTLKEANSQQKEIVMKRFIQMVSTTSPHTPIDQCDNNWIAHGLISTKWDNIRVPKNKNKELIRETKYLQQGKKKETIQQRFGLELIHSKFPRAYSTYWKQSSLNDFNDAYEEKCVEIELTRIKKQTMNIKNFTCAKSRRIAAKIVYDSLEDQVGSSLDVNTTTTTRNNSQDMLQKYGVDMSCSDGTFLHFKVHAMFMTGDVVGVQELVHNKTFRSRFSCHMCYIEPESHESRQGLGMTKCFLGNQDGVYELRDKHLVSYYGSRGTIVSEGMIKNGGYIGTVVDDIVHKIVELYSSIKGFAS